MMHEKEWIAYLVGAVLTLAWKFVRYLYNARLLNRSLKKAAFEWFFDPSAANATSWITTIGVVWTFGVLYIDKTIQWTIASYIEALPLHMSFAFMLGSIMEFVSPAITKWIVDKVPWPWQGAQ